MRACVSLGFYTTLLAQPALAQEQTHILEELFRSEIVYPQEAGEVQLTFAPEFGRSRGQPVMPSFSVEYGLTDAWQIGCGWQHGIGRHTTPTEAEAGEGELEFSVKRSFMHVRDSGASLALGFEAARATEGDAEDGGLSYAYRPFAVFAKDFPRWNTQLFALGSVDLGSLDEPQGETAAENNDKTEWAVGGFVKLGPVVVTQELNWSSSGWYQFSPDKQVFWTPGVVWKAPSERAWELGLAVSVGLSSHADPLSLFVTLTHEIETTRLFGR